MAWMSQWKQTDKLQIIMTTECVSLDQMQCLTKVEMKDIHLYQPLRKIVFIVVIHHLATMWSLQWGVWYVISLSVTCGRSVVFSDPSTNNTDHHDITEILLKEALIS